MTLLSIFPNSFVSATKGSTSAFACSFLSGLKGVKLTSDVITLGGGGQKLPVQVSAVPVPAALPMFGAAPMGLGGLAGRLVNSELRNYEGKSALNAEVRKTADRSGGRRQKKFKGNNSDNPSPVSLKSGPILLRKSLF